MEEIHCPNCNDLLDISHALKKCPKCDYDLTNIKGIKIEKNAPFYSHPPVAFFTALLAGLMFVIIAGNIFSFIGLTSQICISGLVGATFAFGITAYKFLVSLGNSD